MAINCGIVGLPNVGKSTIFSALTNAPAEAANYPFCTINPNIGIVNLPDKRLKLLAEHFNPKRVIPAAVEFVDIAGLVKGASKGEGLGNQFLSHIREVGVIAHVVRCFDNDDIVHVAGKIDPVADIETINIELALADLASLDKRTERAEKAMRMSKEAQKEAAVVIKAIEKIRPLLQDGKGARLADLTDEEKDAIYDTHLITMKPQMYVCNVDENGMTGDNEYVRAVKKIAEAEGADVVIICGKFEAELSDLESEEERLTFLAEAGLEESGLSQLARAAYN
ncbi:redox-regulated ATPase YchF, partial [Treponema pedis]